MRHDYADVNSIRLHYVTEGTGETIVFLHGFPEFWYAWKKQLAEFGRDHQAIAVDLRGYNLSSKPSDVEQYQISYLVEDIWAFVDLLGVDKIVLVAHDWGGVVAWAFALRYPERLRKLVIINAPHPAIFARELRENPAQQQASHYMLIFRSPQAEEILSANNFERLIGALIQNGTEPPAFSDEDLVAYREAWSQPGALTGGLNYYRAARPGPPASPSGGAGSPAPSDASLVVRVPTLVIWGEQDRFLLTGNLEGLDQFVPDLTIERIPNGTHWVIHEQPELVNGLIRRFIS